jgi:NAD(P)-dependent dehydrogenase (short-subunit alcohol dehydrogenase family)
MELVGKCAVVTGGGRGIGAECARGLAAAGAKVAVCARTAEQVSAVAEEIGNGAAAIVCDVGDPDSVAAMAESAERLLGPVDILVNNAGASHSAPLVKETLRDWSRMLAVNATGTFLCMRELMPAMIARKWGRVVNVASVSGLHGARYVASYTAAKHAVIGLTRCAAAEVAAHGVTVNAVCPGYVDTPMTVDSVARIMEKTGLGRDEALEAILKTTPQHRLITPEEVAAAVIRLCGEDARGINGQSIVIDGGALLA